MDKADFVAESDSRRYAIMKFLEKLEVEEKVVYIAEKLKNTQAANNLLDLVETAILVRLPDPEDFELYHS